MTRALAKWLEYRGINDEVVRGERPAKVPVRVAAAMLPQARDWAGEQRIATKLHALLSEVFDAASLPDPNVKRDSQAAVKLAKIAIAGKLPSETVSPTPQGFIFMWPVLAVVGVAGLVIMYKIRSDAELQLEKERTHCLAIGACSDYGFWVKAASVAVLGWIAWDKLGLRERASDMFAKKEEG